MTPTEYLCAEVDPRFVGFDHHLNVGHVVESGVRSLDGLTGVFSSGYAEE